MEVSLVFPDGDGLDAAEKLAELKVGVPFGYMAVEVVVHGFVGDGWKDEKESKDVDFDSCICFGYIVDFAARR